MLCGSCGHVNDSHDEEGCSELIFDGRYCKCKKFEKGIIISREELTKAFKEEKTRHELLYLKFTENGTFSVNTNNSQYVETLIVSYEKMNSIFRFLIKV